MKLKQLQKIINGLIDLSFRDGKLVEPQVIKSIKALKSLPSHLAIEALTEYLKELKRLQRKHTMHIQTVIPLSNIQLEKIKKMVEKKVKVTKIVTQINPAILGGVILTVGDEVWDESILEKLNQVKEAIAHGRPN